MTSYIIKSIVCSGMLLLFYRLFLEKEKMNHFNRFYLLFSIIFSLIIPFSSISIQSKNPVAQPVIYLPIETIIHYEPDLSNHFTQIKSNNLNEILPTILYSLITSLLLVKLGRNLAAILTKKSQNEIIEYQHAKVILMPDDTETYTFLNYIFVSKSAYNQNQIDEKVLAHEFTHVRQKHSFDILFIEIVKSLLWFNPFFFLYKKSIQLNHEFLADIEVLKTFPDTISYQQLLFNKILSKTQINLASSFNYSITKKRLAMMTKTSSPTRKFGRKIIASLFILILGVTFSEKIYSQKVQSEEKNKDISSLKTGLSPELMDEFNNKIKQFTRYQTNKKGRTDAIVTMNSEISKHVYDLFTQMNAEQKKQIDNLGISLFQMSVPVKKTPDSEIFEKWKNPYVFGVWINNKKVENSELEKYAYTDIVDIEIYKLYGKAKTGRPYKYQLELLTNDYFDKTYQERMDNRILVSIRPIAK